MNARAKIRWGIVARWAVLFGLTFLAACQQASSPNESPSLATTHDAITASLNTAPPCTVLPAANSVFLYVSTSGNNSTAVVGDRTLPWATINGALAQVPTTLSQAYVIEIIDSGTYAESVNLTGRTTTAVNTLTIRTAAGAGPTISNGTANVPLTVATSNTNVVGLTLSGPTGATADALVISAATTNNQILCNSIRGYFRGIVSTAASQASLTIEGNRIESNRRSAVVLTGGTNGLAFRRNVVDNNGTSDTNTGPALDLANATSPIIVNNTFYNNSTAPADVTRTPDVRIVTSTNVLLKNNVLGSLSGNANKRSVRLDTAGSMSALSQYNLYWYPNVCTGFGNCPSCGDNFSVAGLCACFGPGCSGNSWQDLTGADRTGSLQGDPLFVAPGATPPDLHEQSQGGHWTSTGWIVDGATSPAVDMGDPADDASAEPTPNGPATGPAINAGGYGGGPQASKTLGTKVVVIPSSGPAGTAQTITLQVQNAAGAQQTSHAPFTANLSTPSGTVSLNPGSISIPDGTGFVTVQMNDSVAEDVLLSLNETPSPGTSGLVPAPGTISFTPVVLTEVSLFTALSGPGRNILLWTNPANHDGVVLLRSTGSPPNTRPTNGSVYAAGQTVGNATVAYSDFGSFAARQTDQGLANGTRYYYRIFNRDIHNVYSAGNIPSSSGIFSEPTSRTAPSPLWCYSFGFPSLSQPSTLLGAEVFTTNNNGSLSSNTTSPSNPWTDGLESFRPTALSGGVQARSPIVPLWNRTGNFILTGDQSGNAYVINAQSGAIVWTRSGLGDSVQAPLGVQLQNPTYSNAAFRTAHPNMDLIFVATRNNSSTNNKVYALSSVDGSTQWTYNPSATGGTMDIVSGGMLVDYVNNRVFVPSRAGTSGTQASVHIISTIDGSRVTTFSLGHVDQAINEDYGSGQAYVTAGSGTVYGIAMNAIPVPTQVWSSTIGSQSSYAFPAGNEFIASLSGAAGSLQYFSVNPTTHVVTQVWSSPTIKNPSGIRVSYSDQKIFVGSTDGKVHQVRAADGVDEKQLTVMSQAVDGSACSLNCAIGMPTIDTTANRLHVGTVDGRLCAFQLPLP